MLFYTGLVEWFKVPRLGGMAAKGFGYFDAVVGDRDIVLSHGNIKVTPKISEYISTYEALIDSEKMKYIELLNAPKGDKKNANKPTEDNGISG